MTDQDSPKPIPPQAKLLSVDFIKQGEVDVLQLRKAKWSATSETRSIDPNARNVFRQIGKDSSSQSGGGGEVGKNQ